MKNSSRIFIVRYWWEILIVFLSIIGICFGVYGFSTNQISSNEIIPNEIPSFGDKLYDTLRFFLLHPHEIHYNCALEISRWTLFVVFLMVTFKLFFRIIAPQAWTIFRIRHSKDNTVICGINELSLSLIDKLNNRKKIVVINDNDKKYYENLRQRGIKVINGDSNDDEILKLANIKNAKELYILKNNDRENIETAYKASEILSEKKRTPKEPLKCFTLVKDQELKKILEDSLLFKYTIKNENNKPLFEGILLNFFETGIKFGLYQKIDIVFSEYSTRAPHFLIIGLGIEALNVINSLAHGLTDSHKSIKFTIIEKSEEKIIKFKEKYGFLSEFAEFRYILADIKRSYDDEIKRITNDINLFSSSFICLDNQVENIKTAWEFRNIIKTTDLPIITFCEQPECLIPVLEMEMNDTNLLKQKNIHIINIFEEAYGYCIKLNNKLEGLAENVHEKWNDASDKKNSYEDLSAHYKQSNRNQVLDGIYKLYLLSKIKMTEYWEIEETSSITKEQCLLLAEMEHRRWMIEKYLNGWEYGQNRDDKSKVHPDLTEWNNLSDPAKGKDIAAVNLLLEVLRINITE